MKGRWGFAVSVEGERSDGSVNQGGKITSNLYVWMHIFVLFEVFFFSEERAIF